jgi:hypothetical protein
MRLSSSRRMAAFLKCQRAFVAATRAFPILQPHPEPPSAAQNGWLGLKPGQAPGNPASASVFDLCTLLCTGRQAVPSRA